jgi:hypothetical protein
MKFYILTSGDLESLRKHAETIPLKEQVIIINTLDDDYSRSAVQYCIENNIEYHVTKSDGTAGTGKNSVMQKFLESDNEYMVQVDGDDKITNFGYLYYTSVANDDYPPDLIVLYNQRQTVVTRWKRTKKGSVPDKIEVMTGWKRHVSELEGRLSVDSYYNWLRTVPMGGIHKTRKTEFGDRPDEELKSWAVNRNEWEHFIWKHGVGNDEWRDVFSRMVFYSRRAAKLTHFTNILKVGEDTIAYLENRINHHLGKINIVRHNETIETTYMYYQDKIGVSKVEQREGDPESTVSRDFGWIVKLNNWVKKYDLEDRYKCVEEMQFKDYD